MKSWVYKWLSPSHLRGIWKCIEMPEQRRHFVLWFSTTTEKFLYREMRRVLNCPCKRIEEGEWIQEGIKSHSFRHFTQLAGKRRGRLCLFIACGWVETMPCNIYRFNFVERISFQLHTHILLKGNCFGLTSLHRQFNKRPFQTSSD